jgi:hypothetical protein
MKSVLKRLDVLDGELTPKQVVLKCVSSMADKKDFDALVAWMWSDEFTGWLKRIAKQKSEIYQKESKGKDATKVNREYRKARQEFVYLYTLAFLPCQHLETDRYRYLYEMTALAHFYQGILSERTSRQLSLDTFFKNLGQLKFGISKLLMELKADQYAERKISDQFFDGISLYLPEQKRFLEEKAALVVRLIDLFMDNLEDYKCQFQLDGWEAERDCLDAMAIDMEEIEAAAVENGKIQFERACAEAKMKVYETEDRSDDVLKVFHETFNFK